jgi:cell division protein FtsB
VERKTGKVASQKAEKPRHFKIRPAYVILGLLMALFAFKFIEKTREIRHLQREEAALVYENRVTAQQNAALRRNIVYYRSTQYMENQARLLLGYTNPGEVPIQSKPSYPRFVAVRRALPPPASPSVPVWKQWWSVFFR